jgi:hypothetical protein
MLAFSTDPQSYKVLAKANFKAFWGLGRIVFRTPKDEKKKPKPESAACESSSQ